MATVTSVLVGQNGTSNGKTKATVVDVKPVMAIEDKFNAIKALVTSNKMLDMARREKGLSEGEKMSIGFAMKRITAVIDGLTAEGR